jgi:hypothetical protein
MGNYYDLFEPTEDECKEKGLMTRHEMGAMITRLTNKVNKLEEENASYKEFIESEGLSDDFLQQ